LKRKSLLRNNASRDQDDAQSELSRSRNKKNETCEKCGLERVKSDAKPGEKSADSPTVYTATLEWVEPFATKKSQKLNLEIRTWTKDNRNYLFACVSPQARDAAIWKQLNSIRDDYMKKQNP